MPDSFKNTPPRLVKQWEIHESDARQMLTGIDLQQALLLHLVLFENEMGYETWYWPDGKAIKQRAEHRPFNASFLEKIWNEPLPPSFQGLPPDFPHDIARGLWPNAQADFVFTPIGLFGSPIAYLVTPSSSGQIPSWHHFAYQILGYLEQEIMEIFDEQKLSSIGTADSLFQEFLEILSHWIYPCHYEIEGSKIVYLNRLPHESQYHEVSIPLPNLPNSSLLRIPQILHKTSNGNARQGELEFFPKESERYRQRLIAKLDHLFLKWQALQNTLEEVQAKFTQIERILNEQVLPTFKEVKDKLESLGTGRQDNVPTPRQPYCFYPDDNKGWVAIFDRFDCYVKPSMGAYIVHLMLGNPDIVYSPQELYDLTPLKYKKPRDAKASEGLFGNTQNDDDESVFEQDEYGFSAFSGAEEQNILHKFAKYEFEEKKRVQRELEDRVEELKRQQERMKKVADPEALLHYWSSFHQAISLLLLLKPSSDLIKLQKKASEDVKKYSIGRDILFVGADKDIVGIPTQILKKDRNRQRTIEIGIENFIKSIKKHEQFHAYINRVIVRQKRLSGGKEPFSFAPELAPTKEQQKINWVTSPET